MAKTKFRKPGPLNKKPQTPPAPKGAAVPPSPPAPAAPDAPGAAPAGSVDNSDDPLIAKVQQQVRTSIPVQFRVPVQKIVMAGSKIMYAPQTHHLMVQALQSDPNPAHAVAMGVVQLTTLMWQQSKGTMPVPAIIPAAILLGCEALDFCEQAKLFTVSPDIVANCVQIIVSYLMQKMGMSPDKIAQIANAPGAGQQPPSTQTPGAPVQPGTGSGAPTPPAAPAGPAGSPGLIQQNMGSQ